MSETYGSTKPGYKGKVLTVAAATILALLFWAYRAPRFAFTVGAPLPRGQTLPQVFDTSWDQIVLLDPDGSLWCWGSNTSPGLLEHPTDFPQRIGSPREWCSVAASYSHALALKTNGTLWGWGVATQERTHTKVLEPTRLGSDSNWAHIAVGAGHCLAVKNDGSLWAWGQNDRGQLGTGHTNNQFAFTQIGSDRDWSVISAGSFSSFALKTNGALYGWGNLDYAAKDDLLPRQLDPLPNFVAISANDWNTLALRSDGTLWIYGVNSVAAAPAYVKTRPQVPVQVGKDTDWKCAYAGTRFFLAQKQNGTWWASGSYSGTGSISLPTPRRLPLHFDAWALSAGFGSATVLTRDGTLWKLSVTNDYSKFAVNSQKSKILLNHILGAFTHTRPFNTNEVRIIPNCQKLWQLPPPAKS